MYSTQNGRLLEVKMDFRHHAVYCTLYSVHIYLFSGLATGENLLADTQCQIVA